jgi:acetylornithine deacetylase/succinyl-diaminopimelate desuccinylase-like protein
VLDGRDDRRRRGRAWLDARSDEMAELLARLAAVNTQNPPGRGLAECASIVVEAMQDLDLAPEVIEVEKRRGRRRSGATPLKHLFGSIAKRSPNLRLKFGSDGSGAPEQVPPSGVPGTAAAPSRLRATCGSAPSRSARDG